MNDRDIPQGLKPSCRVARCGTAEAVPFVQGIFPSEHRARGAGVETADLSTTLRSGRDDKFVVLFTSVRRTGAQPVSLQQICHLDRSEPGFPASLHRTRLRVRLSLRKAALSSPAPLISTGNPG